MKRKILIGIVVLCLAGGLVFAQTQSSSGSNPAETAEVSQESFTDMSDDDRIAKLRELMNEQSASGNQQAAAYLQGRIDFLNN